MDDAPTAVKAVDRVDCVDSLVPPIGSQSTFDVTSGDVVDGSATPTTPRTPSGNPAHGSIHISARAFRDMGADHDVDHPDGSVSIILASHPLSMYITGTHAEIDGLLDAVRSRVAVARRRQVEAAMEPMDGAA